MELLDKLKKVLDEPVKLSDTEKEKLKAFFDELRGWLNITEESLLESERDEAYRRAGILVRQIAAIQKVFDDPKKTVPIIQKPSDTSPNSVPSKPYGVSRNVEGVVELEFIDDPDRFPVIDASKKPTKEQFQAWLNELEPKAKSIADRLDCVKDFPELGNEVICNECSKDALSQCIRNEDPSYTDSDTMFIERQLR
jgi:hypothetical protein